MHVFYFVYIYIDFIFLYNALLQRSLRKSLEEDVKNAVLHEKSLLEEIKSLKSQLAAKEKERLEKVEALHDM